MYRTLVVVSISIIALASSGNTALAQTPATRDSVSHSYVDTGPVVDTASRKLRRDPRDLALGNCALRSQSPVGYVLPMFCARRLNGLIDRAVFDSVTFVGNDREIWFSVADSRAVNRFNHDRRMHVLSRALLGAGVGFVSTLALGLVKAPSTNNQGFKTGGDGPSIRTALIVGGAGALAGALSGSRYSGDFPPYLADSQH
jgi:hypothetical protein